MGKIGEYPDTLDLQDPKLKFVNERSQYHAACVNGKVPPPAVVDIDAQNKRLIHHKNRLLALHPFFGMSVIQRKVEFSHVDWNGRPYDLASVNADGIMRVNPGAYSLLAPQEAMFLLAHEALHYQLGHPHRCRGKNIQYWNVAADMVVNTLLQNCGVGQLISGCPIAPKADEYTAEAIYRRLVLDNPPQEGDPNQQSGGNPGAGQGQGQGQGQNQCGGNGDGDGNGQPDPNQQGGGGGGGQQPQQDPNQQDGGGQDQQDPGQQQRPPGPPKGPGDDLSPKDSQGNTPGDSENKQKAIKAMSEMASQMNMAKNRGNLPGQMQQVFDDMVRVKTNWYDDLYDYLQERRDAEDTRSFARPNRRHMARGVRLPTSRPDPSMGTIVFGFDTSGSMSDKELRIAWGHAYKVIEMVKPERVIALFADADVNKVVELDEGEQIEDFRADGRGGTSFRPIFKWVDDNIDIEEVGAVIYMTDGFGDQEEFKPACAEKTVWLCTTDPDSYNIPEFPWGKVIQHTKDVEEEK